MTPDIDTVILRAAQLADLPMAELHRRVQEEMTNDEDSPAGRAATRGRSRGWLIGELLRGEFSEPEMEEAITYGGTRP